MIEELKSKLKELELKRSELQPKINEIEAKRAEELQEVNKKYDHMVSDVNIDVHDFKNKIMNEIIDLFSKVVMDEFDAKRSTSDYMVTDNFKDFRESVLELELFPKELITRLDKVIDGDPIENIAYDLEKIEAEYKKL
jgi:enoyl-[acyl-carrier-protein] reductase (NADH)